MFISILLYLVSPGYVIRFNASEYEFDVNVYLPVGTVVFEALLITENLNELATLTANFRGSPEAYGPYSLNGMDETVIIDLPFPSNPLLSIALDESLEDNDDEIIYDFGLDVAAFSLTGFSEFSANVILHKISKLLDSQYCAEEFFILNITSMCLFLSRSIIDPLLMCMYIHSYKTSQKEFDYEWL